MLEDIVRDVRARLPEQLSAEAEWEERARTAPAVPDFAAALRAGGMSVIAEIKRRSPSAGAIAPDLDPASVAGAYARGGAAAVSVLTEPDHFGGSLDDLDAVRGACDLPLLRKDFVIHPVQVAQAKAHGAAAVLLIAAILDDEALAGLVAAAAAHGMSALVEAHTAPQVARAAVAGAQVIGVNNRDLTTFDVDLATAERLRDVIPAGTIAVAESGITSPDDARRMAEAGYDAVLVGQAAAQSDDPARFVARLLEAA